MEKSGSGGGRSMGIKLGSAICATWAKSFLSHFSKLVAIRISPCGARIKSIACSTSVQSRCILKVPPRLRENEGGSQMTKSKVRPRFLQPRKK